MFPKHHIERDAQTERHILKSHEDACRQKQIEFRPFSICEFFADMDVLQIRGEETGEHVFGIYLSGRLVGTVYFGSLYKQKDLNYIQENYLPKRWSEIEEYAMKINGVWYAKFDRAQYAWIYERVLTKI